QRGPKEYYYTNERMTRPGQEPPSVQTILSSLNEEGYWSSALRQLSHPYRPIPSSMPTASDDRTYAQTMVGDEYDTSPYNNETVMGISTRTYIQNMTVLIQYLRHQ
ncbi:MAG: hypothetical protein J5682_05535, partial [Prevotella sp.]|nr:hypothetical protein [Prevotella sp.]